MYIYIYIYIYIYNYIYIWGTITSRTMCEPYFLLYNT